MKKRYHVEFDVASGLPWKKSSNPGTREIYDVNDVGVFVPEYAKITDAGEYWEAGDKVVVRYVQALTPGTLKHGPLQVKSPGGTTSWWLVEFSNETNTWFDLVAEPLIGKP